MDPTGQLTIAAHNIPLAYGKLLRLGLDAAIIPLIDSSAHSLNDLIAHQIDCKKIGAAIADAIGIGSASTFEAACTTGITAAASFVYSKIDAIDGTALSFGITGAARAMDKDNDRTIDSIVTGTWAGTLSYGTTPTPLAPATFFGERM
jgi:urease alpha subunit